MFGLMTSALPLILGGVMLLLGVAVLVVGSRNEKKAAESKAWPTAPGTITESRLVESTSTDSDGMTSTTYTPTFRYSYEVGGKKLEGTRLNRGMQMAYDRGTAQRIMQRYPQGAQVAVYYNPAELSEAVLETSARGGAAMRIIGIAFAAIGGLCLLSGLVLGLVTRFAIDAF